MNERKPKMAMKIEINDSRLNEKLSKFRQALRNMDTGPLQIAQEVVDLANNWEDYRSDAGDIDCTSWLRAQLRPGVELSWWKRRARQMGRPSI